MKIFAFEETCFKENSKGSISGKIIFRIVGLGKERGLKVRFFIFNPAQVREFICQEKRATKIKVAKKIGTQFYPWLSWRYMIDSKRQWYEKKYHLSLFDAVALGIYCYYNGDRGKRNKEGT